ncbi:complex I assembly factor TIMMDC1, mitochondrial-like [Argiope bruennichi]|uniref:complex I assembly factor TIMMDC1, mitochondrial-like n=1 Tax=Argiope bruennichi TaxID=94029 RepID=UPI0024958C5E|nr:complex I assembly factor TIMMDC1, mitochondrial-like [Argiope bruennichi]
MVYLFLKRIVRCASEDYPVITEKVIKDELSKETGWDRIKRMYSTDEFGISPEMNYIVTTGKYMFVITAFFGGFGNMIRAKEDFLRKNMATTWESQHLARRSLTDTMTLALFKGGAKSALKYGSFSSLYLLTTMTAANYRDKISIWDHAASGAALGALARLNYGLKGFAVAGALGGCLGLVAGSLITMTLGINGMTMDEFRCFLHEEQYLRIKKDRLNELKKEL